jgi:hypothetical protein
MASMSRIRVFIGYGYNARDEWVETHIIPLVKAFGCTVVHGKAVFGGVLPIEIVKLIQASDAMLGFTTRRDPDPANPGQFTTHPWVIQELTAALSQTVPIPWVEVREEGVVSPGGMIAAMNAQRIDYREAERADCLLNVALALERFANAASVTTVRLGPESTARQIQPFLGDATFLCRCQILRRGEIELPAQQIPVLPIKGGLFVKLRGIEEEDLVRLTISARAHLWRSDYESVDTVDIQMKGDG